jgi:hypothetical protein
MGSGDAQLVDAVPEDRDVLLDGAVLDLLLRLGLEPADEAELARGVGVAQHQVRERFLDLDASLRALRLVAEADDDIVALARYAGVLDLLLAHE